MCIILNLITNTVKLLKKLFCNLHFNFNVRIYIYVYIPFVDFLFVCLNRNYTKTYQCEKVFLLTYEAFIPFNFVLDNKFSSETLVFMMVMASS